MESEVDLWRSAQRNGLGVEIWGINPPEGHETVKPLEEKIFARRYSGQSTPARLELLELLAKEEPDLFVFRYPVWVTANGLVAETFKSLFVDRPVVAWVSEQGPSLPGAVGCLYDGDSKKPLFRHVAITTRVEWPAYQEWLPKAQLHYLPFGCSWSPERFEILHDSYDGVTCDFVADGGCHYACGEYGGWKQISVDTMVVPLLDQRIDLWGQGPGEHGWLSVPGAEPRYRGMYTADRAAEIYVRSMVYVGISWNWAFGGYGCKLARALASGVPVLWHRTRGMDWDGLLPGVHLMTSGSPEETRCVAAWLLEHPDHARRIGDAGRKFALENWEWSANLRRLVEEVKRDA